MLSNHSLSSFNQGTSIAGNNALATLNQHVSEYSNNPSVGHGKILQSVFALQALESTITFPVTDITTWCKNIDAFKATDSLDPGWLTEQIIGGAHKYTRR